MTIHSFRQSAGRIACVSLAAVLAACSNDSGDRVVVEPPVPERVPFQTLYEQGADRYLGLYSPMLSETDGNVVNHTFGTGDGPMCLDGGSYIMSTRDQGSEDLVIYLQGGGACWSEFCQANTTATPGIPKAGILDTELDINPVADWNVAYFNYCDGGLHVSDRDTDTNGDGTMDRIQRGLHNLSAGLDVTVNTFPAPRRILLTGISGGGYGTTFALPLVRKLYPDVPIEVINDSGVGIGRPDDPGYIELLRDDWNFDAFLPEGRDDLYASGHITYYLDYLLQEDPDTRLGLMSYTRDFVIAVVFSQIGGEAFEAALVEEMALLEELQPERVRSFIREGGGHTFLLGDLTFTAGGVSVTDWVSLMLGGGDDWESVSD